MIIRLYVPLLRSEISVKGRVVTLGENPLSILPGETVLSELLRLTVVQPQGRLGDVDHLDVTQDISNVSGFAEWFSCPVCAFRICSGCASVDIPDYSNKERNTLESILVRQIVRYWNNEKRDSKVESFQEESPYLNNFREDELKI